MSVSRSLPFALLLARRCWRRLCHIWGNLWSAFMIIWGTGVCLWALVHWPAPHPLPLLGGVLLLCMLLVPLLWEVSALLALHEPRGPRGSRWLVWQLSVYLHRSALMPFLTHMSWMAQWAGVVCIFMAVANMHLALLPFAVTPLVWREPLQHLAMIVGHVLFQEESYVS